MKLSQKQINELTYIQNLLEDIHKHPGVAGIDAYKVTLAFKSFIETFATYVVSKFDSEKLPYKLSTVCGGTLFITLATDEEYQSLRSEPNGSQPERNSNTH